MADLTPELIGKKLAKTIFLEDGRALLRAGVVLTHSYIQELRKRGYTYIYVENELAPDVVVEDAINEETRVRTSKMLKKVVTQSLNDKQMNFEPVEQAIDLIIEELQGNSSTVYNLSTIRNVDNYTFEHSVNVAVLSIILGSAVHMPYRDLKIMGTGAILHDLGKAFIPEVITKPARLTPEEIEVMKTHTWLGFNTLRNSSEISLISAHVALQHHEKLDGSGYPRGLRGNEILDHAKVVAVGDIYDAVSTDRVYRPRLHPNEVSELMMEMGGTHLEIDLVQRLFRHVAIYPTGSILLLDTGEIGVVVEQNRDVKDPTIRVVTDSQQQLIPPYQFRLASDPRTVKRILNDYPPKVVEQIRRRGDST